MTRPPPVAPAAPNAAALWRGSDRVTAPLGPARAALGRLERLGHRTGPVLRQAGRAAFLLAPGAAEPVPDLLRWLGWGPELRLPIGTAAAHPGDPRVPEPRTADWLRAGAHRPALDLRSPDLLRLLDALADACARERLGLPPAR
ncbi:hypothetical protein [Kitasatospora phosalacinea]|uniref:Uncharacterized protein n=1 Tax=Kitasatospora phosalacinea TaxID=2065 RepID=A0A9W6PML7_9ACTN|nr:hypothetical protein [Kitasatospora phosalacinea]GLW59214.1 hypothetical protein Kpho01_72240 [Kitasatospora phosalacinea]